MSLKKKTIWGLFWAFLSQFGKLISQFIIISILAHLLSPENFGLIAMATVFTEFALIFVDMGIGSALIQKQDAKEEHYCAAFWFNILVGLILMLLMMLSSPLIAKFYKQPQLQPILMALSLNFVLSSFNVVQQSLLMKEMEFKKLAIRDIGAAILSGGLGIYLAFNGFGVWSLVVQLLSATFLNSILLWGLSSWRPRLLFSLSSIKDIASFGGNLTGFTVINYFSRNIDKLLIGKFLGSSPLGLYSLAYRLMLYPLQNISWVVARVSFPVFSKVQNELDKVRNFYLRQIKAISLITFPLMGCLFVLAPEFVIVVLGTKWNPIITPLRIFCLCGMSQSIGTTVGPIYMSQGRADILFKLQFFGTGLTVVAILVGFKWGIIGVSVCYTLFSIIWNNFNFFVINKLIGLKNSNFYLQLKKSCLITFTVALIVAIVKIFATPSSLLSLCITMCVGLSVYFSLLLITKEISFEDRRFTCNVLNN